VKSRHGTTPLECISDAKSAVRYVRAHASELGIDPGKIIVAGGSAGGHIAACTAVDGGDEPGEDLTISSKANALVLHNPVLGEGFGMDFFSEHPEFSPILHIRKGMPPTIISCGTADKTTPFAVAQRFTKLMKESGNTCELIPVKDADHSCDWPVTNPNFLPTLTRMTRFLQEQKFILFNKDKPVTINVDLAKEKGPIRHIWAWFGYDEPNYTYMKDGKKLLSEIAALSPVPVYIRAHNLMNTGDGTAALKWGSTNMYTEDKEGNPVYNWIIIDKIFDTYIERKMKPLAQIGFMPEALSTHPFPYKHDWAPGKDYKTIITGWAYPPKDYKKWAELIYQWVKHSVDRYGKTEVESWYWELWNEPNGDYLMATNRVQEYCKMYDFASDAVKRALPEARIGGPHTHGGGAGFVRAFIEHCLRETNYATGKIGAPLDFVGFHAKGSPRIINGRVRMGMSSQFRNMNDNFAVIASFPEIKNIPVIIGESDPEGCAACGMTTNPENAYRNGTMYSSYTAASVSREYDLAEYYGINLIGAVNWSFEFENQPWFAGFRDLATNGVDKPVLNVFRMLGMMAGSRVAVSGNLAYNFKSIRDSSVRGNRTDINALACKDKNTITVLLWNYHDDDIVDEGSPVELKINGVPSKKVRCSHYRIDQQHSNSYEAWKKMGSPQNPTADQVAILEKAGQLELINVPKNLKIRNGTVIIKMQLPRQAVSLVKLTYLK
jgi:xylan 1,4-beta-xylosidase